MSSWFSEISLLGSKPKCEIVVHHRLLKLAIKAAFIFQGQSGFGGSLPHDWHWVNELRAALKAAP